MTNCPGAHCAEICGALITNRNTPGASDIFSITFANSMTFADFFMLCSFLFLIFTTKNAFPACEARRKGAKHTIKT
jgi:hypothetical protein